MLLLKIVASIALIGGIGTIFYVRMLGVRESKKIANQLEKLSEKLQLQLDTTRKKGNELFPMLTGAFRGRNILIERRLQEKFKYWVVSIDFQNANNLHWQVLAKEHLRKDDKMGDAPVIQLENKQLAEKYILITNNEQLGKILLDEMLHPFWQKHQQITFLFSTVIAYQNRLTLVLLSSSKKLKNDLLLDLSANWLTDIAETIEKQSKS